MKDNTISRLSESFIHKMDFKEFFWYEKVNYKT